MTGCPGEPHRIEKVLGDSLFVDLCTYFSSLPETVGEIEVEGSKRVGITVHQRRFSIEKEGPLSYDIDGHSISHKSDFVMGVLNSKFKLTPVLNIEIKHRSCVSDAFKARSYDQFHLKKSHPFLFGVLVYVKPSGSGISFEQARKIGYLFDVFIPVEESELDGPEPWQLVCRAVDSRMRGVANFWPE
jgi:hypothetical protein